MNLIRLRAFHLVARERGFTKAASAAGFDLGVVFENEFRPERRFQALEIADAALSVGEYAVCTVARRHVALVAAFMAAADDMPSVIKRS